MAQTDDLRRTVLDASLEMIEAEGLAAFSMRAVARRAGVSHQAPYHHFGDREGILAAICEEGFAMLRDAARQGILDAGADPLDRLRAIGRAYVDFAKGHPAHFTLMFRSEFISPARFEALHEKKDTAFDILVSVMNDVTRDRIGREDGAFATMGWGLAHGLATLLLEGKLKHFHGDSEDAHYQAVLAALDAFCELLRTPPSPV